MSPAELREEIAIELENLDLTAGELRALEQDVQGREPTVRETTAAGAFLAQFYTGVENILKRLSRFHRVPIPAGEAWHVELFQRFCAPPHAPLPCLFNAELAEALGPFRRFRHVVHHGYGFELDWARMQEGLSQIDGLLVRLKSRLTDYLESLPASDTA